MILQIIFDLFFCLSAFKGSVFTDLHDNRSMCTNTPLYHHKCCNSWLALLTVWTSIIQIQNFPNILNCGAMRQQEAFSSWCDSILKISFTREKSESFLDVADL